MSLPKIPCARFRPYNYYQLVSKIKQHFPDTELPDGGRLRWKHRILAFDRAEPYNNAKGFYYVTHPNSRADRLVQVFPLRYFSSYGGYHLLARCCFLVIDVFGNYDKSALTIDSPEMIFVAVKEKGLVE